MATATKTAAAGRRPLIAAADVINAKVKREVWPTGNIAHMWAAQDPTQPRARNPQGNLSFRGASLRSYTTEIARLIDAPNGERVALIRENDWGTTTGGHIYDARHAVSHMPRFTVDELDAPENGTAMARALRTYADKIREAGEKTRKARDNAEWKNRNMLALVAEANAFAVAFARVERFAAPDVGDVAAKMARAEVNRTAREERNRVKNEQARKERAARDARRLLELAPAIDAWIRGDVTGVHARDDYVVRSRVIERLGYPAGSDAMAFHGLDVVTTRGAIVPIDHVARIAPIVIRQMDRSSSTGEAWTCPPAEPMRVGHFTLTGIDARAWDGAGRVTVGCHNFAFAEVRRINALIIARADELATLDQIAHEQAARPLMAFTLPQDAQPQDDAPLTEEGRTLAEQVAQDNQAMLDEATAAADATQAEWSDADAGDD